VGCRFSETRNREFARRARVHHFAAAKNAVLGYLKPEKDCVSHAVVAQQQARIAERDKEEKQNGSSQVCKTK
jgi:hypothetical protein